MRLLADFACLCYLPWHVGNFAGHSPCPNTLMIFWFQVLLTCEWTYRAYRWNIEGCGLISYSDHTTLLRPYNILRFQAYPKNPRCNLKRWHVCLRLSSAGNGYQRFQEQIQQSGSVGCFMEMCFMHPLPCDLAALCALLDVQRKSIEIARLSSFSFAELAYQVWVAHCTACMLVLAVHAECTHTHTHMHTHTHTHVHTCTHT